MKDQLTSWGYGTGWQAVRRMPEPAAKLLFRTLADEAWRRRGKGGRQLERNLARVLPDASPEQLRELSREGMRSYLRYWNETFRLPQWDSTEVVDRIVTHNTERIFDYRGRGRGLIAVFRHFGDLGPLRRLGGERGPSPHHRGGTPQA